KRPSSVAFTASCCERSASASHSARVMPRFLAMRSADWNWSRVESQGQSAGWKKPGPCMTLAPRPTWLITSTPQAMPTSMSPERRPEVVRLRAGPALRVDGRAGDAVVLAARQPGVPGDVVRLLAGLGHAAADDLLDLGRVDAGARDHRLLHLRQQMGGVERRE